MKALKLTLVIIFSLFLLTGCVKTTSDGNTGNTQTTNTKQLTAMINSTPQPNQTVTLKTTKGDIKIELFNETMPITANNFLRLAKEDFYDGVIFHRVIDGFMIQGGDPEGTGMGGPGYTIPDEFGKDNQNNRGTIAMANSGPNTGGSQFFINQVDNNYLDAKHPVFGKVVEGMDIVDAIAKAEKGQDDKPLESVVIEDIEVN